jgi:hypothetical protein
MNTFAQTEELSLITTDFSVLRSRLTGTLTTPDDTGYTACVDAFNSTTQPPARCRRTRGL